MDFVLQSTFLGWTGCRVGVPCISLFMRWVFDFSDDVVRRWSLNFGFVVLLCPMLRWGVFRSMGSKFLTLPTLERVSTSTRFEGPTWQSFLISSSSFSFGPRKLNDSWRLLPTNLFAAGVRGGFLRVCLENLRFFSRPEEIPMYRVEIL